MAQRQRKLPFLLIALTLIFSPHMSHGDDEVEYRDPGQITFRSSISNMDFEEIDPLTGSLTLTYQDISFPGNGGLDLQIYRTYKTDPSIDLTVFGNSAWGLHFGRLRRSGDNLAIELQDGTTNSAIKERPDSAWQHYYIYRTKDFWKANMQGTPTLQLPDGTEIVFGHGGTAELDYWYFATEIRKNNSAITIHYAAGGRIDHVVDTTSRRFDFYYVTVGNLYRLSFITCAQDPTHRKLVSYGYASSGDLQTVAFPDGDTWRYQYAVFSMINGIVSTYWIAEITTPYGGTIKYDYDDFKRADVLKGYRFQLSVSKKTVSGSGLTNGIWTYDYGVGYEHLGTAIHRDYTTITDPCGRVTTYHFFGYAGGFDDTLEANECYKYGLIREKFTVDAAGKIEEAIEYTWDKLDAPLSILPYEVPDACIDYKTYVPVLARQTTYHGGTVLYSPYPDNLGAQNPEDTYATLFEEHDEDPPFATSQALRTTSKTYWYNENKNIVKDKPSFLRVEGLRTEYFDSSFDYDSNGNLIEENKYGTKMAGNTVINGIKTTHTYHGNGNLQSSTDANDHTITYEWSNGKVKKIDNSIFTIQRAVNWDGSVASETNGRGHTTSYTYTPGMRLAKSTPPAGNPTISTYHFGTGAYSEQTRGTFVNRITYDGLGKEIGTWDSIGKTTNTRYKACGLKEYTSANTGDTTHFDTRGRIIQITHQDGKKILYRHHADSHVEITDEENKTTNQYYQTFSPAGEKYLTEVRDADHTSLQCEKFS